MRLLHEIAIFQTVKSKVIISLLETVRLSVSISLRNLHNSLNSIKEIVLVDLSFVLFLFIVTTLLIDHELSIVGNWVMTSLKLADQVIKHGVDQ